jgi:hypothetical protein
VHLRILVGCALLGAVIAGGVAAFDEHAYRAHAYVIRVPPAAGSERGLELARSERVLKLALKLAGRPQRGAAWLARHSSVELTSRLDFAIQVETPNRAETAALATAYAKAVKRSLPSEPGLITRGRGARDARPTLGPLGWAMLGGAIGLWVGAALVILRSGSAPAPRPASAPGAPARRATPG